MPSRSPLTPEQQRLVQEALGLVQRVARRVARRFPNARQDDLFSVGQEALVEAARTFDPSRGVPFEGFAYIRVHGEVRGQGLREAAPLRDRLRRALTVADPPTLQDEEVPDSAADDTAAAHGWARDRATALAIAYLLANAPADPETTVAGARDRASASRALREAMSQLEPDDAALARAHYVGGVSLSQIAEQRQLAERTVQRHHRRILATLRQALVERGITAATTDR